MSTLFCTEIVLFLIMIQISNNYFNFNYRYRIQSMLSAILSACCFAISNRIFFGSSESIFQGWQTDIMGGIQGLCAIYFLYEGFQFISLHLSQQKMSESIQEKTETQD